MHAKSSVIGHRQAFENCIALWNSTSGAIFPQSIKTAVVSGTRDVCFTTEAMSRLMLQKVFVGKDFEKFLNGELITCFCCFKLLSKCSLFVFHQLICLNYLSNVLQCTLSCDCPMLFKFDRVIDENDIDMHKNWHENPTKIKINTALWIL